MTELTKVALDNELDLILAHKRSMKLAELVGLSLAAQTSFATAVSEVSRGVIEQKTGAQLTLGVTRIKNLEQYVVARIDDQRTTLSQADNAGFSYAKRLVDQFSLETTDQGTVVTLLTRSPKVNSLHIENWKRHFNGESAATSYEGIRQKNQQLENLTERLQESESQYRMLTNSLPQLIFTATSSGDLLYANQWLKEYTGESIQVLNATRWKTVIPAEDLLNIQTEWHRQVEVGQPFKCEFRIKNAATGDYLWHLASALPMREETGKVQYWIGFIVDIHAQKMVEQALKANEELQRTKRKLEQYQQELELKIAELNRSNYELAQFAYVASHDLQEPLRKIQSFSTMLMEQFVEELPPTSKDFIQRMHSAAERMHSLLKDLLAYSRLNTQPQTFDPVDLQRLLKEVYLDLETVMDEKKATLDIGELPVVQGHTFRLRQLFQNLLSNALKFSAQEPHIWVSASEVQSAALPQILSSRHATYFAIAVTDNGIGFDEKYQHQIFQLFHRLHGHNKYSGTGIGLAICKKVAEMHGGTIVANSVPGQGSTFTVYLPVNSRAEEK